jgi:hypothetical protein
VAVGWLAAALPLWGSRADDTGPQPSASVPAPDGGALPGEDEVLVEEITIHAPTRLPEAARPGTD